MQWLTGQGHKPRLARRAFVRSAAVVLVLVLSMAGLWIVLFIRAYKRDVANYRERYLAEQKAALRDEVHSITHYIGRMREEPIPGLQDADGAAPRDPDQETRTQAHAIQHISMLNEKRENYVYIIDGDGRIITHVLDEFLGRDIRAITELQGAELLGKLSAAAAGGGGLVEYDWAHPRTGAVEKKLAYAARYDPWNWIVGTGIYLTDMQDVIGVKTETLHRELLKGILHTLIVSALAIAGALALAHRFATGFRDEFTRFRDSLHDAIASTRCMDPDSTQHEEFREFAASVNDSLRVQQQSEARLRQSEQKLRALFDQAFQMAVVLECDGTVQSMNGTALTLAGAPADEITGRACWDGPWWHDDERARERLEAAVTKAREGELVRYETDISDHAGRRHRVDVSIKPLRDDNTGQVLSLICEARDITERRDAEAKLRQLAAVVENAEEVVVITDEDGVIQYVNSAFERVTGYSAGEALGQRPGPLLALDPDDHAFHDSVYEALGRGEVWSGVFTNRRKDGRVFREAANITPIRSQEGTFTRYVSVGRDVTHEHLLETRLRQAEKMEALGVLAGGIAHDFNNILSAVFGFAELGLAELPDDHPAAQDLKRVLHAGARARDLVRQILTFSRQIEGDLRPLSLVSLAKETVQLIRGSVPSSVSISAEIDPACPPAFGDPAQLHQVMMNLCTNAYQAMAAEGGTMTVELQMDDLPDAAAASGMPAHSTPWVRFSVRDTGPGMDSETCKRVFEPYFSTRRDDGGTGLGLATAHGIVTSHDGWITVRSAPGHGATFDVYLPSAVEEGDETQTEELPAIRGNGEHVFLVEDESAVRRSMATLLKRAGFKVSVADSADDALQRLNGPEGSTVDVLLTDHAMPGMTGLRLVEALRPQRPDLPVIVFTGYATEDMLEKAEALDVLRVMDKPLLLRDLALALAEATDWSLS